MIVLLYPAKSIEDSMRMSKLGEHSCSRIYQNLGEDGNSIFKKFFENNNKEQREMFFTHAFIVRLWPSILANLKYEHCFKRASPNLEILPTYALITTNFEDVFKLSLPEWWSKKFGKLELNGI